MTDAPKGQAEQQERLLRLADAVEDSGSFDMTMYRHECGTPACIAGHAAALAGIDRTEGPAIARAARDWLGLDEERGSELFWPENEHANWWGLTRRFQKVTRAHAGAVLRHLAETGRIDWSAGTRESGDVA